MQQPSATRTMRMDEDTPLQGGDAVILPDGVHTGIIKECYGQQSAHPSTGETLYYLQLEIMPHANPATTLRYGCPFNPEREVTTASRLGRLLQAFGFEVKAGSAFTLRTIREKLLSAPVKFQLRQERTDRGQFAAIVEDSIRPSPVPAESA